MLISRGARSGGGLIKGVVPAEEKAVGDLLQKIDEGSADALEPVDSALVQSVPPIVIGKDLAETLGAKVGDSVLVTSPQGGLSPLGLMPKYQKCIVVGIFKSGFYQYDSNYAFMRLKDSQKLFSEPDLISVISFKVDDLYKADQVALAIEREAGKGFQTTSWMEQNRELFRALKLEQIVTFIVLALIVCVAALNILIALTMMVMEKTRDIAVLMSFGVTEMQVRRIFLLQVAADQRDRHTAGTDPRLRRELGRRTLPVSTGFCGVLARLPAVCTTSTGWSDCGGRIAWGEFDCNAPSQRKRGQVLPAEALR